MIDSTIVDELELWGALWDVRENSLFIRVPLCKKKSPLGEQALKDRTRITLDGQRTLKRERSERAAACTSQSLSGTFRWH